MRKVTDNELDKIFRDAADRNEPEFDPKDWEDMAKRLDQDDKAALSRSKTLYSVVALLIISTLWPQFNEKDKSQTASMMASPAAKELKDETLKEQVLKDEVPASKADHPIIGAASNSENDHTIKSDETIKEETVALEKGQVSTKGNSASEKGQLVKKDVNTSTKHQPSKKESSVIEKDGSTIEPNLAAKRNRSIAPTTRDGVAKGEMASQVPATNRSSDGKVSAGLGLSDSGLIEAESNQSSAKAGAIVSEKENKNLSGTTPVAREQQGALTAAVIGSSRLATESSSSEKNAITQQQGTSTMSTSERGLVNESKGLEKETSDRTLGKQQSIMGEAAAAGNDRLPSSANGEIILMNDGPSQLHVQPQSPPIILEGISETKKDGSPGIAATSESKVDGNEETSAAPNATTHSAEHAGSVAKDSTQQAERNIAPVPAVADSGTVQKDWKNEKQAASRSWFVKLPVSPDFSSINYTAPGKPGINIGLLGEYSLSRHFSVSTGAIYSKKLYDSKNPDKSYSSGGWTAKASSLNGDCRVLDIPINVTYYIFPESKTNLFMSLGASSYIMLKEKYVYTVWANQRDYEYEENFSHKNNEWFSMLNISIGVQRRLGEHFFVQVEPFLKAPMSGVGEGKVNLVSTGVFFSLKYKLGK
jgi:hypothetical protein